MKLSTSEKFYHTFKENIQWNGRDYYKSILNSKIKLASHESERERICHLSYTEHTILNESEQERMKASKQERKEEIKKRKLKKKYTLEKKTIHSNAFGGKELKKRKEDRK